MKQILLILMCVFAVNASTYYVSTTGNNSASGDITHPWLTINHACSTVVAGDSILVNDGEYNVGHQTTDKPSIVFVNSGTITDSIVLKAINSGGVRIYKIAQADESSTHRNQVSLLGTLNDAFTNYIVIDGFIVTMDSTNMVGFNFYDSKGITIKNCTFNGNNIHYEPVYPHDGDNHEGIFVQDCNGIIISDCIFNNIQSVDTAYTPDTCNINSGGVKLYRDTNVTVQYCNFNNCCNAVYDKVWGSVNFTFKNNIVSQNENGIHNSQKPSKNRTIKNNIFIGSPIISYSSSQEFDTNMYIYNNTVYIDSLNSGRFRIYDLINLCDSSSKDKSYGGRVYNNLMFQQNKLRGSSFIFTTVDSNKIDYIKYNLYSPNFRGNKSNTLYTTLSSWQTATMFDSFSIVTTDPQFEDALNGDFRIKTSSPAYHAGLGGTSIGAYTDVDTVFGARDFGIPPAITVQPVNDTVAIGDTASFTLTATGATSYQWYINSSPVGTNSNTLKFVADSTMDSASIYCTVSNGESVNSNTVNLIVYWFYRDSITTLLNAKGIETMSYFAPSHRPSDPKQCAFIKANYDWVTTGFNFNNICKGRRTYSFAALDSIINYEYGIGKKIEYNALFWGYPNTIPTWLRSAGYNSDTLKQVCFEYIDTMFNRYRGKIQSWQLFNEILGANVTKMFYGNYLDSNITNFYKVVTDYANSKKGSMLIGYNDYMMYNLPYNGNRIYLRVLDSLHRAGLSFDYLGWQCHMYVDSTTQYRYNFLTDIYNRTKSYFNVPIDVTEFDIRIPDTAADTAANFIKQSQVAKSFVYQFVKQLGVRRFGFWGWDDGNSWVPTSFPGYGYATPRSSWDNVSRDYPTKPLYSAIVNALKSTNESIVNQNNNEIMIRVNYTAIPKDLTNQTMMFDLHRITSTQFWSTVKTGGTSIGLFDSSGNTLIATQLTDFNSTTKRGWLMWTDSVDCDKFKYYKIKLMGGTYEKTGSAISKIDMLPDFSDNITDKTLTEKTGNVIFDSVVNSGTFTQDTCKYGYYLKSNGSNLISSKTASATLRNDTGSYTIIFRYDTTSGSSQSILTFTDKVANKINSWVSSVFGSTSKGKSKIQLAPSLVDSTWHIVTFTWERTRARMLIDGRKLEDTTNAYVAPFSGNVTPSLFAHYNSTESYNGAISKVIVYDTVQSLAKQSFMHAQLSDNQGVFEFNEPSGQNRKMGAFRKAYKDVYRNAWK